jgi:hypothetical protein
LIEPTRLINKRTIISASTASVALLLILTAFPIVKAQSTDFTLSSTPTLLCVNPGIDGRFSITLSSLGGSGTVNLSGNIDPVRNNGPALSSIPSSASISDGQPYQFDLTASTTQSSPTGAYTITIQGISGSIFHQTTTTLVVSNNCSVGGTIVPTSSVELSLSTVLVTASVVGIAAVVAVSAIIYSGHRKRTTDR